MKPSAPSPAPARGLKGGFAGLSPSRPRSESRRFGLTLLLVWALVFLSRMWEPGLKLDAMTYAALAKHILSTGDWFTLHYTPAAYANFYQHPPLVIWMQAAIFKTLGASDMTARVLPALFGLGTVGVVYAWGRRTAGPWVGFVAGVILLSSPRYVKFATDLFLDGPLAFWLMAGMYLSWRAVLEPDPNVEAHSKESSLSPPKHWIDAAGAGACLAAGFMTKGLVAFALPLTVSLLWITNRPSWSNWPRALLAVAVAGLLVGCWITFGQGDTYLRHYWQDSVTARLAAGSWREHLDPASALLRTYWPWLPFFGLGLWTAVHAKEHGFRFAAGLCIVILGAFTYTGHYLDHYLVPFFPAAALVCAAWLAPRLAPWQQPISRGIFGLAATLIIALAVLPIPLHSPRGEPLRSFVQDAERICHVQSQYLITSQAMERWMALAVVLWATDRNARAVESPPPAASAPDALLVTHTGETVPLGWIEVQTHSHGATLRLYQPQASTLCH